VEEWGSKGVEDVLAMGWILGGGYMIWCKIVRLICCKETGNGGLLEHLGEFWVFGSSQI